MRKIAFNEIYLEITRRCQLKCAHCMRGDAQNVDMSYSIMDRLLEQTNSIDSIIFTGGEPTLNVDGMKYFLDGLIRNNIPLGKLSIVTNGVLQTQEIIKTLHGYYDWISQSENHKDVYIRLGVSDDKYHIGADVDSAIDYYRTNLSDCNAIRVYRHIMGKLPRFYGRAKLLAEAHKEESPINSDYNSRIEVLEPGKPCFCPYRKYEHLDSESDARVLCSIYISAFGNIINRRESEFDMEDKPEYQNYNLLSCDILDIIEKYNTGRTHCIEKRFLNIQRRNREFVDILLKISNRKIELSDLQESNLRQEQYIHEVNNMDDESGANASYPLSSDDVLKVFWDFADYIYSDDSELARIYKQHPILSRNQCENLRYYQTLYKKYNKSKTAKDKAIARGIKKKIDDLLLLESTVDPYIGVYGVQDT